MYNKDRVAIIWVYKKDVKAIVREYNNDRRGTARIYNKDGKTVSMSEKSLTGRNIADTFADPYESRTCAMYPTDFCLSETSRFADPDRGSRSCAIPVLDSRP